MPPIEKHVKISLERTGKEWREVHEWLDGEPAKKAERHDITKIPEYGLMFKEKYGDEAVQEYLQHLHDDIKAKFKHIHENMEKAISDTLLYFGIK
jgi:bifunctional DNA-binding transcriptional regulator/antitoxin component of YhaV-PrlF toxin-antitoxin module